MNLKFIKREIAPMVLTIAGNEYPAIFNFRALIETSNELQELDANILVVLLESSYDDYGNLKQDDKTQMYYLPIPSREFLILIKNMMVSAGVDVSLDDLIDSVRPNEMNSLIVQARNIIRQQNYENDEKEVPQKNGKNAAKK